MTNPFQLYGRIASKTSLSVFDTHITPYTLFNFSKNGDIIVINTIEQTTRNQYRTYARDGTIKFDIWNTDVTDEATYTYTSGEGDAVNFTLLVEGIGNDYTMLYVVVVLVVVFFYFNVHICFR